MRKAAAKNETNETKPPMPEQVTLGDFVAYLPMHTYCFMPTTEMWPASSVNSQFAPIALLKPNGDPVLDKKGNPKTIPAATWLDKNRPVHAMTWSPGEPVLIPNRLMSDGGWIEKEGVVTLNLYRPPAARTGGDARKAKPWLDHVKRVYPNDHAHIVRWMAHRVQRAGEKINHALMLGGAQGIGKDTLLEPLKRAVGPWNFAEVNPVVLGGRFNAFLRSVVLRVSEARDLGESNRFAAYEHMKTFTAAPPDTHLVDEKNLRAHKVLNVTGVIVTSNHLTDGVYLPADDRRTYVAWSELQKKDFTEQYWLDLWNWYETGGIDHVWAYLEKLDLATFNAKAPPLKTEAFWRIVNSNRSSEEGELSDLIEKIGKPDAFTLDQLIAVCGDKDFKEWLTERRNRRAIPHRIELAGYIAIRNPDAENGLWRIDRVKHERVKLVKVPVGIEQGKMVIYARKEMTINEQFKAAKRLRDEATIRAKAILSGDVLQIKPKG